MNCPICNKENAYIGFSKIECVNKECIHYSNSYMNEKMQEFFLSKEGKEKMSNTIISHIDSNLSDEDKLEVLKYYDSGAVSMQTLFETFNINYNEEIERMRFEKSINN